MQNNIGLRELEELKKVSKNYKKDIKKINKNYPIQYLIGCVDFYGYNILVNKDVLIPRPETEYLVEKTIKYLKKYSFNNLKILDLCTGSGCISIVLKKEIECTIDASDISSKALKVSKENSELNKININFIKSNLFKKINNKYDLIISNPPYVSKKEKLSKEVLKEPHIALFSRKDGTEIIEKILLNAEKYMNNKSILAMEINSNSAEIIKEIISKSFRGNIKFNFEKDLTGKTRYLFIFKNCE